MTEDIINSFITFDSIFVRVHVFPRNEKRFNRSGGKKKPNQNNKNEPSDCKGKKDFVCTPLAPSSS